MSPTDEDDDENVLSAYLTKQLLLDFEASNKTRKSFDPLAFCNTREERYGTSGSKLRRRVQQRFKLVKQRKIHNYIAYLSEIGLEPGPKTKIELLEADESAMADPMNLKSAPESNGGGDNKSSNTPREEVLPSVASTAPSLLLTFSMMHARTTTIHLFEAWRMPSLLLHHQTSICWVHLPLQHLFHTMLLGPLQVWILVTTR